MPIDEVREILKRSGMPRHTDTTITDPEQFTAQLACSAEHGYAVDEGEQETGVRCVAVAIPEILVPTRPVGIRTRGPRDRPAHRAGSAAADQRGQRRSPPT